MVDVIEEMAVKIPQSLLTKMLTRFWVFFFINICNLLMKNVAFLYHHRTN